MADTSKAEKTGGVDIQSELDSHANEFWFLEDEINRIGTPAMKAAFHGLHVALGVIIPAAGYVLPARVAPRSGGPK